ncbi:MAG TPA: hypothetical protein VIB08_00045, partial [Thermoanaerobaculia bacterium]
MKARTVLATLVCFLASLALYAADPNMGTWKLNESKSKLPPSGAKNTLVVCTAAPGDAVDITVDGVDSDGKTFHSEWLGRYDGKDYPIKGDTLGDSRSYTKVDANTLSFTGKMGGKTIFTGTVVVSADGKSRTVTASATDAQGKTYTTT